MKQYKLKAGMLGRSRKLTLAEDYLEFESKGQVARINKEDIEDFKHGVDEIVWYKFTVGQQFSITFKDKRKKETRIVFKSYFGMHSNYYPVYAEIVENIWKSYHHDIISLYLDKYYNHEELKIKGLKIKGLKINQRGIELSKENHHLLWNQVGIQDYCRYFAIFNKENPHIHIRISFNEYETEILWSVVNTILKEKKI